MAELQVEERESAETITPEGTMLVTVRSRSKDQIVDRAVTLQTSEVATLYTALQHREPRDKFDASSFGHCKSQALYIIETPHKDPRGLLKHAALCYLLAEYMQHERTWDLLPASIKQAMPQGVRLTEAFLYAEGFAVSGRRYLEAARRGQARTTCSLTDLIYVGAWLMGFTIDGPHLAC